ncbi:MAG: RagB/SusD family nutrient uptake outer membrane protein [Chitinophagaceae bacterium]
MKKNKINSNNSRLILILAVVLSIVAGCKNNFLDRDPQGFYTEDTYPYPGGSGPYDTYLFAAYSELRTFNVHSQFFIFATSVRSDDADRGSSATDGVPNSSDFDDFPVNASSTWNNGLWLGYYSMVNKCNIALDQIKKNTAIIATPQAKIQSEGEAKLLRGYAYFMLVRLFGRVPLIDSIPPNGVSQSNVPQSQPAAIYALIESDLQFAAANLPATWDSRFIGRGTSGAANGLLAKVYLTQNKWALAMGVAQMVINSNVYGFAVPTGGLTSFDFEFREQGENSKESIFEVQATASATVPTANGVQYAQIQGVRGAGIWNLGIGWNVPSTYLEAAFEANDPRKKRTILYMSTSIPPVTNQTIYGENTPVWNASSSTPNPRYNGKTYTNPALRSSYNSMSGWWFNVRLLRYADVVLMFAEAANEVGGGANTTAALAALNSVRARARAGAPAGTLPDVTTTDQAMLRDAIRQERRVELAMEHDRFFDLVRWGIAQTVLNASGKPNFSNGRDVLLPIPQQQIDLSQGVLTKNPGY